MRLETTTVLLCEGRPLVTVTRTELGVEARLADSAGATLLTLTGKSRNAVAGLLEEVAGQVRNARTWPPTPRDVTGLCLQPAGDPVGGTVPLCEFDVDHQGPCGLRGLSRLEQHASDNKEAYEDEFGPRRRVELDRAMNGERS